MHGFVAINYRTNFHVAATLNPLKCVWNYSIHLHVSICIHMYITGAGCWKNHPYRIVLDNGIDFVFLLQVCYSLICFEFSFFVVQTRFFRHFLNWIFISGIPLHCLHGFFCRTSVDLALFCWRKAAGVYVAACHTTNLRRVCLLLFFSFSILAGVIKGKNIFSKPIM